MNSGFVLDQRQHATTFDPHFGEWCFENGRMVEVVVQCTHPRQDFNYPPYAAKSKVYRVRVDPRSKTYRQRELDQALPKIQDALLAGQDVIFHCMQSFHRAPVTAAAAYRRVTGGSAGACCLPKNCPVCVPTAGEFTLPLSSPMILYTFSVERSLQ